MFISIFEQKWLVSFTSCTDFSSFLFVGDGKFLVTSPGKNRSSLTRIEDQWHKEIFAERCDTPHSAAVSCQANNPLVVAALSEKCVHVKDIMSGTSKR